MSKTAFYQTDFKPDYQLFQQKISQLSAEKSRITKKQISLEKLQHQLELIKQQIDDQGLEYDQSSIFVRYATIQEIAQKKKTASDCCMHCGQEMKKTVQCQICAEVYCKNCCWRKRAIPNTEHQDFRLCCEQCHQKYIKHFNNQEFYKQKGIYLAAIDQLSRKYEKTKAKYEKKQAEVNQYKEQKRAAKIKQGNLKKAVLDQEKRIKQLTQDFEKAVKQKAIKMKEQQERKKQQQIEEKKIKQKQEIEKRLSDQMLASRMQQEQRKLQEAAKLREQELVKRQAEIQREKQKLQKEKKQLSESRLKQLQELQKKKSEQKSDDNKPIIKFTNEEDVFQNPTKHQPPRQIVSMEEIDFDSILKNEEQPKPKVQEKPKQPDELKKPQQPPQQQANLKQLLKEIKNNKKQEKSEKLEEKEQKQEEPEVNEAPRLTMTQIKTMSINDLLSMKIPMNPSASKQKRPRKSSHPEIKVDAEQNSTTTQNQKMYQSLLEPYIPQSSFMVGLAIPNDFNNGNDQTQEKLRNSIHSVKEEEVESEKEKENHKKALLRRQSLISSVNKGSIAAQKTPEYNDQENTMGEPQKCTCEIM